MHARLRRLPPLQLRPPLHHVHGRRAATPLARLRGLAGLPSPDGAALLLPRTSAVHTLGMRFALDLVWLDRTGNVARLDEDVRPGRLRTCAAARGGVIEVAAGRGRDLAAALGRQASGSWSSSRVREPR